MGHSYGALVALVAAHERPEAVRSLVLAEPPLFGASDDPAATRLQHDLVHLLELDIDDAGYGEPVAAGGHAAANDRTVLDMGASDFSSYGSHPDEDDSLPSFEKSSELPSFDDEPVYSPAAGQQPSRQSPPPPPPAAPMKEENPNKRRNTIIAIVAILLLCCCCSVLLSYFYLGDIILEYMQF